MEVSNPVRLQQNLLIDPQRADLPIPGERPEEDHILLHQFRQGKQIGAGHHQTLLPRAEELAQQQRRAGRSNSRITECRLDRRARAALLSKLQCPSIWERLPNR